MPRLAVQFVIGIILLACSHSALAQLPDAPRPQPRPTNREIFDENYIFLGSLATVATFGDYAITVNKMQGSQCFEINASWLLGKRPSPARAYSLAFAESAAALGGSYLLRRSRNRTLRKLWSVPLFASGADHAYWWYRDTGVNCPHAQTR